MSWPYIFIAYLIGASMVVFIFLSLRPRAPDGPKFRWSCIRKEGGGTVLTPYPMTEENAIQFVSQNLGMVMYVDRDYHFIFYRPRAGT